METDRMMKEKMLTILRIALVALFLSYYGSVTLFPHTHLVDGGVVTHSHPYAPSSSHTHTQAALQLIAHLGWVVFLVAITASFLFIAESSYRYFYGQPSRTCSINSRYCQLRAPPVCLLGIV